MVNQPGIEMNPKKVKAILKMKALRKIKDVQRLIGRLATLNMFISKATNRFLPFFQAFKFVQGF